MFKRKCPRTSKIVAYTCASACLITGIVYGTTHAPRSIGLNLQAQASDSLTEFTTANFVGRLLADDERIREEAFAKLQRLEPSDAVTYLVDSTKDPDWQVRAIAVYTLGRLGKVADDAIPNVIEVAQADENSDVRFAATKALGEFGSISVEPVLIAALEDPDENIRLAAAQALTKLAPIAEVAFPALVKASWDGNWMVRNQAVNALTVFNSDSIDYSILLDSLKIDYLEANFQSNKTSHIAQIVAQDLLVQRGVQYIPTLIEQYRASEDYSFRQRIAYVLGEISSEDSADFLLEALIDENLYIPEVAIALGKIDPVSAISALEPELRSIKQAESIRKLGFIKSDETISVLERLLSYGSEDVRESVIGALSQNATKKSMPLFHELLRGTINYNEYLFSLADEDSDRVILPFYVEKLTTGDIIDQKIALSAIWAVSSDRKFQAPNNLRYSDDYATTVTALINSLEDEDDTVRSQALYTLSFLGRESYYWNNCYFPDRIKEEDLPINVNSFLSILVNSLPDGEVPDYYSDSNTGKQVRSLLSCLDASTQVQASNILLENLDSTDQTTLLNSIYALNLINIKDVLPKLVELFEAGNLELRSAIISTLADNRSDASVPLALLALFNPNYSIENDNAALNALYGLQPRITEVPEGIDVESLKAKLMSSDFNGDDYRAWAGAVTNVLEQDAKTEIISFLRKSLTSEDSDTRYLAAQALGEIEGSAEDVVPNLVRQLQSSNDLQSYDAISYLGEIGPQASEAIPVLKTFLESKDWIYRYSSAVALARIKASPDCFIHILEEGWQRDDEFYFAWTSEALGENGSDEAIAQLIKSLRKKEQDYYYFPYDISCYIPEPISELHDLKEKAVPQLSAALSDPFVRFSVSEILGDIGSDSVPELLRVAKAESSFPTALDVIFFDKNQDIRRSAIYALKKLDNPSQEVIQTLKAIAENKDDHIEVRWMAAVVLQRYGFDMQEFFILENQPNPLNQTCHQISPYDLNVFDIYQKRCLYSQSGCGDGFRGIYDRLRELLVVRSSDN